MKLIALFACLSASACAQSFNTMKIIPVSWTASPIQFYDNAGTNYTGLVGPAASSGNVTFHLPNADGSNGQCLQTNGSSVLSFGACLFTFPFSGSYSGASVMFGLTDSGSNTALSVSATTASNPAVTFSNSAAGDTFTVDNTGGGGGAQITNNSSTQPALALQNSGTGNTLTVTGNAVVSGLLTQDSAAPATWYAQGDTGFIYANDFVSRYVFNSAGDVPQTGTGSVSGSTFTLATGGPFDLSWKGGTLYLCTTTCNTNLTNATGYLISGWTSGTQITLTSPPSAGSYSFSYQANAFQTSQGTMQITGGGYFLGQNMVVTNGFTSLAGITRSGTVNTSGTSVTWASGGTFDPSMQGGTITIGSSNFTVSSVQTPGLLTLASSAGTLTGASYSYTSTAFQVAGGAAYVKSTGEALFTGLTVSGGTGDAAIQMQPTGLGGASSIFMPRGTTNCWEVQNNSSLILAFSSSSTCSTPTTEVTFTSTNTTFAQPVVFNGLVSSGSTWQINTSGIATLVAASVGSGGISNSGTYSSTVSLGGSIMSVTNTGTGTAGNFETSGSSGSIALYAQSSAPGIAFFLNGPMKGALPTSSGGHPVCLDASNNWYTSSGSTC